MRFHWKILWYDYCIIKQRGNFCTIAAQSAECSYLPSTPKGECKMIYGVIDRKNHKFYTYLSKVFQVINNAQNQYNWLITDWECYPKNKEIIQSLDQKYCWLSGEELTNIVVKEDFQWIWGCLCGFQKDISPEEVLGYPLPLSEGYNGYYENPVSLQHPLSSVEIVPSDSSWTLIISKDKTIIDSYIKKYPKSEDLSAFNQK